MNFPLKNNVGVFPFQNNKLIYKSTYWLVFAKKHNVFDVLNSWGHTNDFIVEEITLKKSYNKMSTYIKRQTILVRFKI